MRQRDESVPTPQADPGRSAYLAACADAEKHLRRIVAGTDAEVEQWAITKAQARRVASEVEQGPRLLIELTRRMRQRPTESDHALADRLAARLQHVRGWLLARWPGRTPRQVADLLVMGRDPEAIAQLAETRSMAPLSAAAAAWIRAQIAARPPARTEEERMRDGDRAAALWGAA